MLHRPASGVLWRDHAFSYSRRCPVSAWIVARVHIDVLVLAGVQFAISYDTGDPAPVGPRLLAAAGVDLWAENHHSVNCRYREDCEPLSYPAPTAEVVLDPVAWSRRSTASSTSPANTPAGPPAALPTTAPGCGLPHWLVCRWSPAIRAAAVTRSATTARPGASTTSPNPLPSRTGERSVSGPSRRLLNAARTAASRGWPVFPLQPYGKRPAIRDWPRRASCDTNQLDEWGAARRTTSASLADRLASSSWTSTDAQRQRSAPPELSRAPGYWRSLPAGLVRGIRGRPIQ